MQAPDGNLMTLAYAAAAAQASDKLQQVWLEVGLLKAAVVSLMDMTEGNLTTLGNVIDMQSESVQTDVLITNVLKAQQARLDLPPPFASSNTLDLLAIAMMPIKAKVDRLEQSVQRLEAPAGLAQVLWALMTHPLLRLRSWMF